MLGGNGKLKKMKMIHLSALQAEEIEFYKANLYMFFEKNTAIPVEINKFIIF